MDLEFSDYIVYVDESGDHSLVSIDEAYPIFVLSMCIFNKRYYSEVLTPAIRSLKFSFFGHDQIILHEHDIRKKTGDFRMMNKEKREEFLLELDVLIGKLEFTLIPVVINKKRLKKDQSGDSHVYHLAMQLGLEKLHYFLSTKGQANHLTHVICEARGRCEDKELGLEFYKVCAGMNSMKEIWPYKLILADKKTNSKGLQIADLAARPVGLSTLRPNQPNRALKTLMKKFQTNKATREILGYGLYPIKSEKPQGSP